MAGMPVAARGGLDPVGSMHDQEVVADIVSRARKRDQEAAQQKELHLDTKERTSVLAQRAVLAASISVFFAVMSLNAYFLMRPPPPPSAAEVEAAARVVTAVSALQIEAFHSTSGRYPRLSG